MRQNSVSVYRPGRMSAAFTESRATPSTAVKQKSASEIRTGFCRIDDLRECKDKRNKPYGASMGFHSRNNRSRCGLPDGQFKDLAVEAPGIDSLQLHIRVHFS